jgi:chromosome segregation ATPase
MAVQEKLEEKIHRTERKLIELSLHIQRLNREYQQLLDDLALTPKQLQEFVDNPNNFSPVIWEQLQNEKKKLDERLNLELNNVHDANKTKAVYSEKGKVQQHWLFVR